MKDKEVRGIVERCPSVFDECPDYVTLGLRTDDGDFCEVFLPAMLVANKPAWFHIGRRLCFGGGDQQEEATVEGLEDYIRYWPLTVRVEKKPEYLF
jgi:hypothetical protein